MRRRCELEKRSGEKERERKRESEEEWENDNSQHSTSISTSSSTHVCVWLSHIPPPSHTHSDDHSSSHSIPIPLIPYLLIIIEGVCCGSKLSPHHHSILPPSQTHHGCVHSHSTTQTTWILPINTVGYTRGGTISLDPSNMGGGGGEFHRANTKTHAHHTPRPCSPTQPPRCSMGWKQQLSPFGSLSTLVVGEWSDPMTAQSRRSFF